MELRALLLLCVEVLLLPTCLGREVRVEWSRDFALQHGSKYVTHIATNHVHYMVIEPSWSALCVVYMARKGLRTNVESQRPEVHVHMHAIATQSHCVALHVSSGVK